MLNTYEGVVETSRVLIIDGPPRDLTREELDWVQYNMAIYGNAFVMFRAKSEEGLGTGIVESVKNALNDALSGSKQGGE